MGLFNFLGGKRSKDKTSNSASDSNADRPASVISTATDTSERDRLALMEEQRLNREAYDLLRVNDDERLSEGARWLLDNEEPILKASVTKIGVESNSVDYSTPYGIEVYDRVDLTDDFNFDDEGNDRSKIVVRYDGQDIGELSSSVRERLDSYDIDNLIGIVSKVTDDDKLKISIAVYEGSDYSEPGYRQLHTIIVGTKYPNKDGTSRQEYLSHCYAGERIKLIPSEYEGKPSVIVSNARGHQLGFLKADLAVEMCNRISHDDIGGVYITKIPEVDGVTYCDIVINIANFR